MGGDDRQGGGVHLDLSELAVAVTAVLVSRPPVDFPLSRSPLSVHVSLTSHLDTSDLNSFISSSLTITSYINSCFLYRSSTDVVKY